MLHGTFVNLAAKPAAKATQQTKPSRQSAAAPGPLELAFLGKEPEQKSAAGVFSALLGPPASKKNKKSKKARRRQDVRHDEARYVPEPQDIAVQNVLQRAKQGDIEGAANLFLNDASDAHGAHAELLEALVKKGSLQTALQIAKKAKAIGPLPQQSLLACLVGIPQGPTPEEGVLLAETLTRAGAWPSDDHEAYFRRKVRGCVAEFLDEARGAIESLQGRGRQPRADEMVTNIRLVPGEKPGELKCEGGSVPFSEESRGFQTSDSVALTLMNSLDLNGLGIAFCECEVVVGKPLVVRPRDSDHPLLHLVKMMGGGGTQTFRVTKLGNRVGYTRMLCALHCIAEPPQRAASTFRRTAQTPFEKRLPNKHRPVPAIVQALVLPDSEKAAAAAKKSVSGITKEQVDADIAEFGAFNHSQTDAMKAATTQSLSLVQGPPGTGKTSTSVRILRLWANTWSKEKHGKKSCILATSDSNIAVDNIVEGLARAGVKVVRLGRPEASRPELLKHAADTIAAESLGVRMLRDEPDKQRAREAVFQAIEQARVVCCTAVGAGGGLMTNYTFDKVLVDEASQATELSTIVPIARGCKQLVLVGDDCQLPPTVSSDKAAHFGLALSLFERLAQKGLKPALLEIQYRMHPKISHFPCQHFYDGRISDGESVSARITAPGFDWPDPSVPVCLLAASHGRERSEGTSFTNDVEAQHVIQVVQGFLSTGLSPTELGVTTPYGAQVRLIRQKLRKVGVPTGRDLNGVEVSSVDAFQGREKDVMVMSTVRANQHGGIGFVADWRRVNVAFTRARCGLVVVCNPGTLSREPNTWLPWIHWAKEHGCHRGAMPPIPPMNTEAVKVVGLSARHHQAAPMSPTRSSSPEPPWKRGQVEQAAGKLFKNPELQPQAAKMRVEKKRKKVESDDEERDEVGPRGDGVGTRGANLPWKTQGAWGLVATSVDGSKATGRKDVAVSASPFVGGKKADESSFGRAANQLGLITRPMKKQKVEKAEKEEEGGGLLGLGTYGSSSSDEEEDDEDTSTSEEEENAKADQSEDEGSSADEETANDNFAAPDFLEEVML